MVASTTGNGTSDFTEGSQGRGCSACSSAGPFSDLLFPSPSQRRAAPISSGKVDAIRTWVTRLSG